MQNNEYQEKRAQLIEDIRDGKVSLSHSAINEFRKSPSHFIAYKLRTKEPTAAMIEGTLLHKMLLEPFDFEENYIIEPENKPSSAQQIQVLRFVANGYSVDEAVENAYKNPKKEHLKLPVQYPEYLQFLKDNKGESKEVIDGKTFEKLSVLSNAIKYNPAAKHFYFNATQTEKHIEWKEFGYDWNGYIDAIRDNGDVNDFIFDLKKVADASPRKVERSILYDGIGLQAAHYTFGARIDKPYYILAVDNAANVSVTEVTKATRAIMWEELERIMEKFERCIWKNDWNASFDFWGDNSGLYYV